MAAQVRSPKVRIPGPECTSFDSSRPVTFDWCAGPRALGGWGEGGVLGGAALVTEAGGGVRAAGSEAAALVTEARGSSKAGAAALSHACHARAATIPLPVAQPSPTRVW